MRFGRRGSGARGGPTGSDVDRLSDLADEAVLRRPDTPEAAAAARRAVEAAERLLERDGALPNQRRLGRALWRRLSTFAMPAERTAVEETAVRCWAVCLGMLDAATGDAVVYDEVVGDLGLWAGVLVPAFGSVGRHAEAAQVYETCTMAAGRAMGAHGRHARARLMTFPLAATADSLAEMRIQQRWNEASERAVADAIESCRDVVGVLRGYQGDGPFEVSEVARVLQVLSRLQTVGARLSEAATSLDEAIAVLTPVAAQGPRYQAMLRGLRAERDGLRGHVPDLPPTPATPRHGVPRKAFVRAARDAGLDPDHLTDAAPDRDDGPPRGVLLAWRAHLLAESGEPGRARELADSAVIHLGRYIDRPQQVQAPLVVALAVLRQAATATGRHEEAARASQRASVVFAALTEADPTYAEDLADTV
jgi:hypothetical protein